MRRSIATVVAVLAAASALAQAPAGPEFVVNSYITSNQFGPAIAFDRNGEFTIAWSSLNQDGSGPGVYAQRYGETGAPLGGEFLVNTITTSHQVWPSVVSGRTGSSVIAWGGTGDIRAQRYRRGGTPSGGEFVVNAFTTSYAGLMGVTAVPGGGFRVTWERTGPTPAVVTRRFDAFGIPRGAEVVATTRGSRAIASGANGRFVTVWYSIGSSNARLVEGQLFDTDGNPIATFSAEDQANSMFPDVAMAADGSFIVVWNEFGSPGAILGRRFSPDGARLGAVFVVDPSTATSDAYPRVSADPLGNFVVSWSRYAGGSLDVMARRFATDGTPRSGEFAVNAFTTGHQRLADMASDDVGNFIVSWTGPDGAGADDSFARRFGGVRPASLAVDPSSSQQSDGNGVLEPGETVTVQPTWRNVSAAVVGISGTIPSFTGPAGAAYGIVDDFALYGVVAPNAAATCSDCFSLSVSAPSPRPAAHWDAVAKEEIAPAAQGQRKLWTLHVGNSFSDVPRTSPFYRSVETLLHHSVTSGCGGGQFCPQAPTTREQMAVFVVVARDAAGDPPPACGTPMFADVPASSPFCRWIEELARRGVVSGCGGGNFCPQDAVTREQMAVFIGATLGLQLYGP